MSVLNNSNAIESGGYNIDRSLRFRSSASAYLNRTPASAGSRTTWTWSGWVKKAQQANYQGLFGAGSGASDYTAIRFENNDQLHFFMNNGATAAIQTTQVFRDPSAWYHIILAIDTTQATASNRIKLYVNGSQISSFATSTYPAQNATSAINNTVAHVQGTTYTASPSLYLDGYLAEVNFIDGQALTPSSFGATDAVTGVWQPKKYTGTYGTNGFYLDFKNNTSATTLAYDKSGNGNNWTANNISTTAGATYDSMTDVPTLTSATVANYCTLNPIDKETSITVADGNLKASFTGASDLHKYRGTIECPSGAWYWEVTPTTDNRGGVGIGSGSSPLGAGGAQTYTYHESGKLYINNVDQGTLFSTYAIGDVIGVAVDVTNNTIRWYKNNVAQGSGPTAISSSYTYFPTGSCYSAIHNYNFGQRPFSYTPPTGFKALNTFNLPDPTIKKPNQYMDVNTWTGTGVAQNIVNSGSMQPDFVWIKARNQTYDNQVWDSSRGALIKLATNSTAAESSIANSVTGFNSNGIALGDTATVNLNGGTFVGWQWKESATAGFDIVTYTGNGASTQTVNHSLGVAPKMIIGKNRGRAADWPVYHVSLSANNNLFLDLTNAQAASPSFGWIGAPSSTTITLNMGATNGYQSNQLNDTFVAYLFAEISGFSKFGSYTGNGSADGPFVYCGFRPKFLLVKQSSSASDWIIVDSSRAVYNVVSGVLMPNTSGAEASNGDYGIFCDFLSNGFKMRSASTAGNTGTVIYAAFAENPMKYANAR